MRPVSTEDTDAVVGSPPVQPQAALQPWTCNTFLFNCCLCRRFPLSVWFDIVTHVEFPTLVKGVGRSCRRLRIIACAIWRKLTRNSIVQDVPRFFELMRDLGAVMAGSAVLHMVCPLFDRVPDYNIFVPMEGMIAMANYLIESEGFEMDAKGARHGTNGCTVGDVRYLAGIGGKVTLVRGDIVVDVVGVGTGDHWDRAEAAVASAWTTLLMNYAAYDRLVLPYPKLTLMGRGLVQWERTLHPTFPRGTRLLELEKYVNRGYEFRTHAEDWDQTVDGELRPCSQSWMCPLKRRAYGDQGCLWLGFTAESRRELTTSWTFGGVPCPCTITSHSSQIVGDLD